MVSTIFKQARWTAIDRFDFKDIYLTTRLGLRTGEVYAIAHRQFRAAEREARPKGDLRRLDRTTIVTNSVRYDAKPVRCSRRCQSSRRAGEAAVES